MHTIRQRRVRAARVTLLASVAWLAASACSSWQPIETRPLIPEQVERASRLRVTLSDGDTLELRREIRIVGDSLVSDWTRELAYHRSESGRQAVALDRIASAEVRDGNGYMTLGMVAGGVLGLFLLSAIAWSSGSW